MDYLEFFGLKRTRSRLPLILPIFSPQRSITILTALHYTITQKEGFFLATGDPGTGKTTILKVFIEEWQDKAEIALVLTPRLSPEEFLHAVLEDLKVPVQDRNKNAMLKAFRDFLEPPLPETSRSSSLLMKPRIFPMRPSRSYVFFQIWKLIGRNFSR